MKKSKKIIIGIIVALIIIIVSGLIIYPNIEFRKDNKLYVFTYEKDNWDEWEQNQCYNESYSYNEKRDISINTWDYHEILFFRWFVLGYKEGNVCETEYVLEEEYIERVIKEAEITDNEDKVNLEKLIKGKKAIVANKRYPWNEEYKYLGYKLDGKYVEMYISNNEDGLLIIQVGNSDEGPKYIAYE